MAFHRESAGYDARDLAAELAREVARRRHVEDQLERANQMNDEFLAAAAHELRTPLATLKLETQSILSGTQLSAERLRYQVSKMDRQADRLIQFVDALLDASRLGSGELSLERSRVDLHAIARRAIARIAEDGRAGVAITLDAPGPVEGWWDAARLELVLGNLIGNALKYGGGVPVQVVVSATPTSARISILDRGIGIADVDQERIFARFVRVAPQANYGGLGLGLWIVRQVVEAHGGTVHVDSVPGEGSTFIVDLPRSS
jgi:signal transduction histidine kinase